MTKEGRELLVEWHGRPVFKEDGEFNYFFGIGIDITEHKHAKQKLKNVRKRKNSTVDSPYEEEE